VLAIPSDGGRLRPPNRSHLRTAPLSAGGPALSLIARPLCVPVLRAHLAGPLSFPDLRAKVRARKASLRAEVPRLRAAACLERHVLKGMPYTVENELTERGRGLLAVAVEVEAWLANRPGGPAPLGSNAGKATVRALLGGWSSGILDELAAAPRSLTELSNAIPELSYPALARRLTAMKDTRQVEVRDAANRHKPYAITSWGSKVDAVLVAAHRWGLHHGSSTRPGNFSGT